MDTSRVLSPTLGRHPRRLNPDLVGTIAPVLTWEPSETPVGARVEWWKEEYTGDPLSSWTGKWAGLNLTGIAGEQPDTVDPSAAFGDGTGPAYDFDGVNDSLTFGTTASLKLLHDGTGCLIAGAVQSDAASATQMIFATMTLSTSNVGFGIRADTVAGAVEVLVADDTGTYLVNVKTYSGSIASGSPFVFEFWMRRGAAPEDEYRLFVGQSASTMELLAHGTIFATPAAGNHHSAPRCGRNGGTANNFFNGPMAELIIVNDVGLEQRIKRYLEVTYL